MVTTLNELALGRQSALRQHGVASGPVSASQASVFANLRDAAKCFGAPPQDLSPSDACAGILGGAPYDDTPLALGSFDLQAVSLPAAGCTPVPLEALLGPHGKRQVTEFIQKMLLPQKEAEGRLREQGLRSCYSDPLLSEGQSYPQFCRRLHSAEMIDYAFDCRERESVSSSSSRRTAAVFD